MDRSVWSVCAEQWTEESCVYAPHRWQDKYAGDDMRHTMTLFGVFTHVCKLVVRSAAAVTALVKMC
jgi:hypothetical protein